MLNYPNNSEKPLNYQDLEEGGRVPPPTQGFRWISLITNMRCIFGIVNYGWPMNRCTIRDAKTTRFHRLCESLNFIVFVVLAHFLIPQFGSYRVGRSVEIKISWWNKCKSGQEQSLDYQRCENNVLSLPLRTYLFFCTNICTKTAFFVQTRVFCKKRWFFCTNRYLYKFRMKKKTLDKYSIPIPNPHCSINKRVRMQLINASLKHVWTLVDRENVIFRACGAR